MYLVLGATPILACSFCSSESDYRAFYLLDVAGVYVAHLALLALMTEPPRSILPQLWNWLVSGSTTGSKDNTPVTPARTRLPLRTASLIAVAAMYCAEAYTVTQAASISVYGPMEHVRTHT